MLLRNQARMPIFRHHSELCNESCPRPNDRKTLNVCSTIKNTNEAISLLGGSVWMQNNWQGIKIATRLCMKHFL